MQWNSLSYPLRHALSVGVSLTIAGIIEFNFGFSHEGWIVLSTFLLAQASKGTSLKQMFQYFILIIFALLLTFVLVMMLPYTWNVALLLIAYIFIAGALAKHYTLYLFFVTLIIAIIFSGTNMALEEKMLDVVIGTIIAMSASLLFFPINLIAEFRQGLILPLETLKNYIATINLVFLQDASRVSLDHVRESMLNVLSQNNCYPRWVYDLGFNRALRPSFRFFLLHLERLVELYFTMDYLTSQKIDTELLKNLAPAFMDSTKKNLVLINILIDYFASNRLDNRDEDFSTDMEALEAQVRAQVPVSLELLDISPVYVTLVSYTRALKDSREELLQLVMSLPATPLTTNDLNADEPPSQARP